MPLWCTTSLAKGCARWPAAPDAANARSDRQRPRRRFTVRTYATTGHDRTSPLSACHPTQRPSAQPLPTREPANRGPSRGPLVGATHVLVNDDGQLPARPRHRPPGPAADDHRVLTARGSPGRTAPANTLTRPPWPPTTARTVHPTSRSRVRRTGVAPQLLPSHSAPCRPERSSYGSATGRPTWVARPGPQAVTRRTRGWAQPG